ncbi:MAG: hypothetical protein IT306_14135 [Chloroflexi bacterium]|nr:hypothetical protein [Chloroflexota bacterium]
MADATADWTIVLADMSRAYSSGDNPLGEELLVSALDLGAPWDLATSTAAQALSERAGIVRAATQQPVSVAAPA